MLMSKKVQHRGWRVGLTWLPYSVFLYYMLTSATNMWNDKIYIVLILYVYTSICNCVLLCL